MRNQYKSRQAAALHRTQKAQPNKLMPRRVGKRRLTSAGGYCAVDPAVVFNDLLPDLAESKDDFAWACCPFHDDNNPSFSVNLRTGWYRCFSSSCGEAGTNIVSFVSALLALEPTEARSYLGANYG